MWLPMYNVYLNFKDMVVCALDYFVKIMLICICLCWFPLSYVFVLKNMCLRYFEYMHGPIICTSTMCMSRSPINLPLKIYIKRHLLQTQGACTNFQGLQKIVIYLCKRLGHVQITLDKRANAPKNH